MDLVLLRINTKSVFTHGKYSCLKSCYVVVVVVVVVAAVVCPGVSAVHSRVVLAFNSYYKRS